MQMKLSGIGLMCWVAAFTMGMGSSQGTSHAPMSIEALFIYCGLPRSCDAPVSWEGRPVSVWGRLDPLNIFDRQTYPQLPYEKFRLVDSSGRALEVWPQTKDNRTVFTKLAQKPSGGVVINGRLVSVEMPAGASCKLGLKVVIDDADQIGFKAD